jgi:general secretion pathway protein B
MSLILEALRRSEEERRRRSLPALAPAPRRRPRRMLPVLGASVALAAILAGAFFWTRLTPPPTPATAPPHEAPSPPSPSPESSEPAIGHRTVAAARASPPPREETAPRESEPAELLRESPMILAPATADPLADPNLDPLARERLAEMLAPRTETSAPSPTGPPSDEAPPAPAPAETPSYEELAFALRREMPSFRVSMIVAASDPAARFVLSEGQRRREGEELAPGIRIVEIGAEGLLLEFRGQRFRWRQTR